MNKILTINKCKKHEKENNILFYLLHKMGFLDSSCGKKGISAEMFCTNKIKQRCTTDKILTLK